MATRLSIALAAVLLAVAFVLLQPAAAQEDWVIRSFDVQIDVVEDGTVTVTENILVDFRALERHGIFRDLPLEYAYDDEHNRLVPVSGVEVDDGAGTPLLFDSSREGPYLRLKIGDPGV